MSMISPESDLALFAALFAIACFGFIAEKTRIGSHLTGAVIVIITTIVLANVGIIPHSAASYSFIFTYIVPVLIPLFLFRADLRKIVREASRTTMAFLFAAFGTVIGVVVAISLVDTEALAHATGINSADFSPALAGLFTSTYIGGSVNYAALGEITGLNREPSLFSAATAADNLFSAVYLALLSFVPAWRWLSSRFQVHESREPVPAPKEGRVTSQSLCISLAIAIGVVAVSDVIVGILSFPGVRYVAITVFSLLIATFVPNLNRLTEGSFELGICLSYIFFAAIAAGADVITMLDVAPHLIMLVIILLSVHFTVTFSLGRLFGLSIPELVTASNAAVLGATTAPALAATKGWHDQVTPGVLVGVLGYALGTLIGSFVFGYLGPMIW